MGRLIVNQSMLQENIIESLINICPFKAIEKLGDSIDITSACKMCKICVKNSAGAISYEEDEIIEIDKSKWRGILVYIDHLDGKIHPVSLELIGKAKELASKINHPVYALMIGDDIETSAQELRHYGVDDIFIYESKDLKHFVIEPYAAVFEDLIERVKPSSILVGATNIGRSLAPRIAARFRTGLTADCTILDMKENTDLIQIRPAFGGNIMAQIITQNHRPQLCTVRYKIFSAPERQEIPSGEIHKFLVKEEHLDTKIKIIEVTKKEVEEDISEAEVIVAVGRALKNAKDIEIFQELADLLNGKLACTRPIIENGTLGAKKQIGLSGRTVKPKLIIACGIQGAVQFTAGMNSSDTIIAINSDESAAIFNIAHYGIVGDMYEIVPKLIENIKSGKSIY
ncbi:MULTISPECIES: electron transfer flavoprotein subunit alpha [unclassified Cetobacterium]|uniref:electron transfer flavoprotein subunit alpha n=1 Tax=unclassified Cetobacterium TaxID=2630983 RepID=UPI002115CE7C|nr:electron transfer flavoprotein subunit alpha [Cetobacterium sp. NK01]MCQ8213297.1 electron transfer flavoprotein subunit alpha [Cetobacterium sp. NK01]